MSSDRAWAQPPAACSALREPADPGRGRSIARAIVTTSWDDGDPLDLRLAELLSQHGLAGTFYVAPLNRERAVMEAAQLRQLGGAFEIGAHGLTHVDLRGLADGELARELAEGRGYLEGLLGRPVEAFCYPLGRYDARVRQAVIGCGFIGARTARLLHLSAPRDPWLLPTTLCARDWRPWGWGPHWLKTLDWPVFADLTFRGGSRSWTRLARVLFERVLRHGGVWHLWGHSWEVEEQGLWDGLREVFQAVSGCSGVAYVTNGRLMGLAAGA